MAKTQAELMDDLAAKLDPFPEEEQTAAPAESATPEAEVPTEAETPVEAAEEGTETEGEETPSEEAAAEETTDDYVRIELNGKSYDVPVELKDSIEKGEAFTQKTQSVARQQEAVDLRAATLKDAQETVAFEESLVQERQTLGLLDAHINQYKQLDWSEFTVEQSLQHKMAFDNLKEQRTELEATLEGKRADWDAQQETAFNEHKVKASEWLRNSIPGWSTDDANQVAAFAESVGYTKEEVKKLIDPRIVQSWYEQMKYRELLKGTGKAKRTASKAPPIIQPGSVRKMPQGVRDKLNFNKQMATLKKSGASEAEIAKTIQKRLEGKMGDL